MATIKLILALVLVDILAHGLKAGVLVEATPDLIKALSAAGQVDFHKDAVANAKANGVEVVRSQLELQAEWKAKDIEAALVEIAKLEDLLTKADEQTKPAIESQLADQRQALLALQA
jgi:hypothetical protein